jgi:hypothetical protein
MYNSSYGGFGYPSGLSLSLGMGYGNFNNYWGNSFYGGYGYNSMYSGLGFRPHYGYGGSNVIIVNNGDGNGNVAYGKRSSRSSDLNNNDGTFVLCKDRTLTHVSSGIKVKVNTISNNQVTVSVTQLGYGGFPQTGGYVLVFGEETTLTTFDNLNIEYKLSASRADDASGKVRITFRTVEVNVACADVVGGDGSQQLCLHKSCTHKDSNIKFTVTKIETGSVSLYLSGPNIGTTSTFSQKTIPQGVKAVFTLNGYTLEVSFKGKNVYGQALLSVKSQKNTTTDSAGSGY